MAAGAASGHGLGVPDGPGRREADEQRRDVVGERWQAEPARPALAGRLPRPATP